MLMDPMGGIVMTNDGNAILREVRLLNISRLSLHSVFLDNQFHYDRILID